MTMNTVEFCCFDEADRLFEMGFKDQVSPTPERRATQASHGLENSLPRTTASRSMPIALAGLAPPASHIPRRSPKTASGTKPCLA